MGRADLGKRRKVSPAGLEPVRNGQPYLVFDIGGTTLRGALYDPRSDALTSLTRLPTKSMWVSHQASPRVLLEQLLKDMQSLGEGLHPNPSLVSSGFPGPVDARGTLLAAPTIVGQLEEPVCLKSLLQEVWPHAQVIVINDVTAAGYGIPCADDDRDDFCVVTVSSGVGCKVFLDGRPVLGRSGRGGELGHFCVDSSPDANVCECGGRGHLAAVASGRGALATAQRRAPADTREFTCELLAAAFRGGDPFAADVVSEAAVGLGTSLAALHTALGLERFVLTGGFAAALGEGFRHLVAEAGARACWDLGQDWEEMVELDGRDYIGLLGAGRYARSLSPSEAGMHSSRDLRLLKVRT